MSLASFMRDPSLQGTRETQPRHLWRHDVELAAIRAGVTREFIDAHADRVNAAYNAGEVAWMLADEIVFRFRRGAIEAQADTELKFLQNMIEVRT